MDDIIATVAWTCDEDDCAARWHQASYWTAGRGYTVDWYSDGDHAKVTRKEIPSQTEIDRSWRDYARDVLVTGEDPLGNYYVKHTRPVRERWRFHLVRSILGVVCCEARHGGRVIRPADFPPYVREYLNLDPEKTPPVLRDFQTLEDARPTITITRAGWTTATIDRTIARPAARVARELRAAARQHLAKTQKPKDKN